MDDEMKEALRRFGDRLEWLYAPEQADDLIELLAPVFDHAGDAEARPRERAIVPPARIRRR